MSWRLFHPRYWLVWLGLGLFRLLVFLPYPLLMRIGRRLGVLAMPLLRSRVKIAQRNLELCFPEMLADERAALLRAHFRALGMAVIEAGLAWWSSRERLAALSEINGFEYLEEAAAKGKGVLLFGAHFTSMEIGGRILSDRFPIDVMYRRSNNPVVDYVMVRARRRICRQLIQRKEVKTLLRSLQAGHAVWYAPDQNTQRKKAVFVEFFGHLAATTPATSRLAQTTGALVIPFRTVRKPDDSGYRLELEPPLEDFHRGDLVCDTQRTNAIIERWARTDPEQYLWIHRRFRTRPDPDDERLY